MNKEMEGKRAVIVSIQRKEAAPTTDGITSLQQEKAARRGVRGSRQSRRHGQEQEMEEGLTPAHVVLLKEFRDSRGGPSSEQVRQQFDSLTRDMHAQGRSAIVVAAVMRRTLGLPEL